jgi:hypothetical protein
MISARSVERGCISFQKERQTGCHAVEFRECWCGESVVQDGNASEPLSYHPSGSHGSVASPHLRVGRAAKHLQIVLATVPILTG